MRFSTAGIIQQSNTRTRMCGRSKHVLMKGYMRSILCRLVEEFGAAQVLLGDEQSDQVCAMYSTTYVNISMKMQIYL